MIATLIILATTTFMCSVGQSSDKTHMKRLVTGNNQ